MNITAPYPVLVGFWRIDGTEQSNETRITGDGTGDKGRLLSDIRAQYPNAVEVLPLGTRIELRTNQTAFIEVTPGSVIRNIFTAADGAEDPVKKIGEVWFSGAPYDVFLIFSRVHGCVLVQLKPKIASTGGIKFSNQINPQRLLTDVPKILAETFGGEARELKLNFREVNNQLPTP